MHLDPRPPSTPSHRRSFAPTGAPTGASTGAHAGSRSAACAAGRRPDLRLVPPFALVFLALLLTAGCVPSALPDPGPTPLPVETVPADDEVAAEQFVLGFLEAREAGNREEALLFLSPQARQQFRAPGLVLAEGIAGAAMTAQEAADASSWEVRVRIELETGGAYDELLFIGPGYGPGGEADGLLAWTVRGVQRVEEPVAVDG